MADPISALDRRSILIRFAQLGGTIATLSIVGGCDGEEQHSSATPRRVAYSAESSLAAASAIAPAFGDDQRLNFVLNLSYLAAQFHAYASSGSIEAEFLTGVGRPGTVTGARAAALSDPLVISSARELAADKQTQLAGLRGQLGSAAAAMPAIDFTVATNGTLARMAQDSGAIPTIDPFADDSQFLLGAYVIEDALAATQRGLLTAMQAPDATSALQVSLAASIYHGGLIRTLIDRQSASDPALAGTVSNLSSALAGLDGSASSGQNVATADTGSSNLTDAGGRSIPFTRTTEQALRLAFLGGTTSGGFFPQGFNGIG